MKNDRPPFIAMRQGIKTCRLVVDPARIEEDERGHFIVLTHLEEAQILHDLGQRAVWRLKEEALIPKT